MTNQSAPPAADYAAEVVLDGVTVTYGAAIGVASVSASFAPGEVSMIVGPNGAGKTTLLRAIAGFDGRHEGRLGAGRIIIDGKDQARRPSYKRARSGVRLVPERKKAFATMTVRENLQLFAGRTVTDADLARVYQHFPALERLINSRAGLLSGGERQMLGLCVAVLGETRVLLVDEMSLGLAPATARRTAEALFELQAERGFTLVMSEQSRTLVSLAKTVLELTEDGVKP